MSDIAIKVENLSKCYMVGHNTSQANRHTALRDVIAHNARNFARKTRDMLAGRPIVQGDEVEEFWALQSINFEIQRGEVVGVIGRNGAGKSTLLKILSRITEPTSGRVTLNGRLASLLEVGTGFHPELSGRENIFLNGAILGMTRKEVARKLDEIVDFAEIERFIDTPVKRYSSGMYVRLAFAVAAHLEADILLVDEVLAVGDMQFQRKCLGKLHDVSSEGRTAIFVSHNMGSIRELCNRVVVLRRGEVSLQGKPDLAIANYFSDMQDAVDWKFSGELANDILVNGIIVNEVHGTGDFYVTPSEPLNIRVRGYVKRNFSDCKFALTISSKGERLATLNDVDEFIPIQQGLFDITFHIPANLLRPGEYMIGIGADRDKQGAWFFGDNLCRINIAEEWTVDYPKNRQGLINLTTTQVAVTRLCGIS